MDDKNIEVEAIDVDFLTIHFWGRGIQIFLDSEEAKELRDELIAALSV